MTQDLVFSADRASFSQRQSCDSYQFIGFVGKIQEHPMIFMGKSMVSGKDFPMESQPIDPRWVSPTRWETASNCLGRPDGFHRQEAILRPKSLRKSKEYHKFDR